MITRFAPSPTGPLHLGHAFSALTAWDRARGGAFLLRIEDIDTARCRPEWEAALLDDLAWLGLAWPQPVLRQSTRRPAYARALDRLAGIGVLYPCRCRRAEIRAALSAPQEGVDGWVYPGTCRGRSMSDAAPGDALRLNLAAACARTGPLGFSETGPAHAGRHPVDAAPLLAAIGDPVLARRDIGTSYHLAVTVDDAFQGVTEVVRGEDLFGATPLHVLLQSLLALPTPAYHHHPLIRDDSGKRLAKRDDARALSRYRADGATPADIRALVGLAPRPI